MKFVQHRALLAAILAGSWLTTPALAETALWPMITVSGEATLSVAPDQAQIEAGVTSDAKTAREAAEADNAAMGKLLTALKTASIDPKDIQTSRLSLEPQYAPNRSGPSSIVGYRASNRVTVKLHDVLKVASTVDMLVAAGATEIGGIAFSVSNASNLLDDSRERAVADARRKAEIYAKAAGVTLGEPLDISEQGARGPVLYRAMAQGMAANAPVAPGEETLQVTVRASWAIKPVQ
jgi:uncharacterized protein